MCVEQYSCEDISTKKNQYGEGCRYFNNDPNFGRSSYQSGSMAWFDVLSLVHSAAALTWCRRNHECTEPLGKDVLVCTRCVHSSTESFFLFPSTLWYMQCVVSRQMPAAFAVVAKEMAVGGICVLTSAWHALTYVVWSELLRGAAVEQWRVFNSAINSANNWSTWFYKSFAATWRQKRVASALQTSEW